MTTTLTSLGFDDWFAEHAELLLQPEQRVARVMTVDRGAYILAGESGECRAELSGRIRFEAGSSPELPCIGDWVRVEQASPELAIIQQVLPRRTFLRRKRPGKVVDFQMIAANIDAAFIVQSCHYDFNLNRLDRYLVVVNEGNIEPIVVLSKTDLVAPDELNGLTTEIVANGITAPLLPISNATGAGLDMLRERLVPGQTYCLLGSSGVGKTTLINRLVGEEAFDTKAVSDSGEGVHTTSRRQLIMLDNGAMLIDTPGMRELGLLGTEDGIDNSFSEISDIAPMCRFANCTHMTEPGCAVLAAVESGDVTEERYESFLKLRRESAFHDMSYVEKRQKDKDLGKFYRSVMRDKKKYKDK